MTPLSADPSEVLPVGAGLYTIYYHPEEGPRSPLTEWTLYEGMTRYSGRSEGWLMVSWHGLNMNMMLIPFDPNISTVCYINAMDVLANIMSSIMLKG